MVEGFIGFLQAFGDWCWAWWLVGIIGINVLVHWSDR